VGKYLASFWIIIYPFNVQDKLTHTLPIIFFNCLSAFSYHDVFMSLFGNMRFIDNRSWHLLLWLFSPKTFSIWNDLTLFETFIVWHHATLILSPLHVVVHPCCSPHMTIAHYLWTINILFRCSIRNMAVFHRGLYVFDWYNNFLILTLLFSKSLYFKNIYRIIIVRSKKRVVFRSRDRNLGRRQWFIRSAEILASIF